MIDMRRIRQSLGTLIVVVIFAGAVWLLHAELKHYSWHDIRDGMAQVPLWHVALSALLTIANYAILTGYDFLAVKYIDRELPFRRVAMASFVGYASSYNFGALLGGISVRYRLYSGWGLSGVEIVRLLAALALTFWLGVFVLAGAAFTIRPLPVPERLGLPFTNVRPLGVSLLALAALYVVATIVWRRPVRFRGWELRLPTLRMTLFQMALATLDLVVASTALYVLLPASLSISYPMFVGVYLLAIVAVVFSHVPAGLGVFELIVLVLLAPHDSNLVVGSLLVFRVIYYLLPLIGAMLLLAGNEVLARRRALGRVLTPIGTVASAVAPAILALATLLAGAVLLLSGAMPAVAERMRMLRGLVPLPVVEGSHFLASVLGAVLVLLAHGLQRRLNAAFWSVLILLVFGIAFSLLKGLDFEEALLLSLVLIALIPCRRRFYRKGSLLGQPLTRGWLGAILLVLVSTIWLTLFAHKHVEYSNELWWHFAFRGDAPRSLRAIVGVVAVVLVFGAARLLRPGAPRPVAPTAKDLQAVEAIVQASPLTYANLALLGDKQFLFNDQQTAFVMYAVRGRSWVAMGDPVGPASEHAELAWRFREWCDRYDGWPVFYQTSQECVPLYLELGLTLIKLGEEARVSLAAFSLDGKQRRDLRQSRNRFVRYAATFEVIPRERVPEIHDELAAVSDAWVAARKPQEKGFSLGFFDLDYLQHFPMAVVRHAGRMIAFANVLYGAEYEELSVDLMRYHPDTPHGVMEFLFTELMFWGKSHGYRWFNLGMAPLSGLENRPLAPLWNRVGGMMFRHLEHFYNFQGLRDYKDKFEPVWAPKYLASPGGLALPRILTDVTLLIGRRRKDANSNRLTQTGSAPVARRTHP